jgi:transcriptional antiterminator RfaH
LGSDYSTITSISANPTLPTILKLRNINPMSASVPWFVLQTSRKAEKRVERLLIYKGYECLLPTYRQKRRWSDRVVESELPLFPMYVFCRFNSFALGKAISTPGVTRIVGFGGQPAEVEIREIEALKLLAKSSLLREPWTYIADGTLVQVETGPLAGAQGVFCSGEDRRRLVISVTLLQRSVAVQLDENTVFSVIEGPKKRKNENAVLSDDSDLALKLIGRSRHSGA